MQTIIETEKRKRILKLKKERKQMSRSVSQFPKMDVDIHLTKNKKKNIYETDLDIRLTI